MQTKSSDVYQKCSLLRFRVILIKKQGVIAKNKSYVQDRVFIMWNKCEKFKWNRPKGFWEILTKGLKKLGKKAIKVWYYLLYIMKKNKPFLKKKRRIVDSTCTKQLACSCCILLLHPTTNSFILEWQSGSRVLLSIRDSRLLNDDQEDSIVYNSESFAPNFLTIYRLHQKKIKK